MYFDKALRMIASSSGSLASERMCSVDRKKDMRMGFISSHLLDFSSNFGASGLLSLDSSSFLSSLSSASIESGFAVVSSSKW